MVVYWDAVLIFEPTPIALLKLTLYTFTLIKHQHTKKIVEFSRSTCLQDNKFGQLLCNYNPKHVQHDTSIVKTLFLNGSHGRLPY